MSKKNKPLLVGVTGGIGSGKSTVCKVFELLNIPVYYADERAKNITKTDHRLKEMICERFGPEAYKNGEINREYMANRVFSDKKELETLNQLIHPRVAIDFEEWVSGNGDKPYILKEAALIYETGGHHKLDKVILVSADEDTRVNRVLQRDNHRSKEDILKIIRNQLPEEQKAAMADFIIENNLKDPVIPQITELHRKLTDLSKSQEA